MNYSRPRTWPWRGFPQLTLSVKTYLLATKTCLTYAFVTQQLFGILSWNLDTCIFVAWTISIFSPHCCKCNGFGCTAAIRWGNACHGTHSDSLYSGSEHSQFNSPRLVKREAGFPNPRRALIGSNQLWCVNVHHTTENYPLFRVRSWNNGMRWMSFHIILIDEIFPINISNRKVIPS